jgi:hypothetical protein
VVLKLKCNECLSLSKKSKTPVYATLFFILSVYWCKQMMLKWCYIKWLLNLSDLDETEMTQFFVKFSDIQFNRTRFICSRVASCVRTNGRTDGWKMGETDGANFIDGPQGCERTWKTGNGDSKLKFCRLPEPSGSKTWSWVLWDSKSRITVLTRASSNLVVTPSNGIKEYKRRKEPSEYRLA